MKKELLISFIFSILIMICLPASLVLAEEDNKEPVFHSINIDKNKATGGEKIKVSVDASDGESGVASIEVVYQYGNSNDAELIQLNYNEASRKYEGIMDVNGKNFNLNGLWEPAWVTITDKNNNILQIFDERTQIYEKPYKTIMLDLSDGDMYIADNDITAPKYQSLVVDKKETTMNEEVRISLQATDYESGIDYATARYRNVQNNEHSHLIRLELNPNTNRFEGILSINEEIVGGKWAVDELSIFDNNFNVTYLHDRETQGNYPDTVYFSAANFTVIDITPPIITGVSEDTHYNKDVTPIFNEGTARLNGKPFAKGSVISDEGSYYLEVRDNVGNKTSIEFYIDKTAPQVTGIANESILSEAQPEFEEGIAMLNDEPFESNTIITTEGHYILRLRDLAGNETVISFDIDQTPPVVKGVKAKGSYRETVIPEFNEGTALLNGTPFESGTEIKQEGKYKLIVTDTANNRSELEFTIDRTGPSLYSTVPGEWFDQIYEKANINFAIAFFEGTTTLNGKEIKSGTMITEEGFYTVIATDALGNQTIKNFTLDKTPPVISGPPYGIYNTDIKPTFDEGEATLNGMPFTSGTVISEEGDYNLQVEDDFSNYSSRWFVIDKTKPPIPDVEEVTEKTTIIKGEMVEWDTLITVKTEAGILGTVTPPLGREKYEIRIPKQKAGTKLFITSTDNAGNVSEPKEVIVKDVIAPSAPSINVLDDNDDIISGKAESNANVYAYAGKIKLGEATAKNGTYSIKIAKQKVGASISIYAVDTAGNKSASKTIKVIDKTAPSVPSINTVNDKSTTIIGKVESGAKVYAYVGSKKLGEASAKNGSYSIKITKQKVGTTISVYAVDSAKNKSASKTIKVIDKTAPSVPIVNSVADNATKITGKAESGTKVYAYVGKKKLGEVTAKSGAYSLKIAKQKPGTSITVYAIDSAKNKSNSKTVKVIDKTAPAAPTVNKVTSKSTAVSGKSEKAATVLIYNGSKKIGQGTVDGKGSFKVKIKTQKKGSTLKVYVQDKAKNKSKSKSVKVS